MLIFCSYSHYDERHRRDLEIHLAGLRHQGLIDEVWHDREIPPGEDWQKEIDQKLEIADIIILLVSPHFISSPYCYTVEMARALERHQNGKALVVPIVIRACDWTATPLSKIQLLPRNGRPVTEWKNRDRAWTNVVSDIRKLLMALNEKRLNLVNDNKIGSKIARRMKKPQKATKRTTNHQSITATEHSADILRLNAGPNLIVAHNDAHNELASERRIKNAQRATRRRPVSRGVTGTKHPLDFLRLSGKQNFLVTHNDANDRRKRVSILSSFNKSLVQWNASARISPIYEVKINKRTLFNESFQGEQYLVFLGPLSPSRIVDWWHESCRIWITLGAFNVVVQAKTSRSSKKIMDWAQSNSIRFELWKIKNGIIKETRSSTNSSNTKSWQSEVLIIARLALPPDLQPIVQDYCSIMASALSRSLMSSPDLFRDLLDVNAVIRSLLEDQSKLKTLSDCMRVISEVNSSVAQLSSQALAGVSPITENESEPHSHSVLGIGVATVGFSRLRRFIESTLGQARIFERLEIIGRQPATNSNRLEEMTYDDKFWIQDHIGVVELESKGEPTFPLIPYFSGDDTFKCSSLSIRSPYNVISGCNSLRWSLLPVSHEISHIVVRSALSLLFPDPANQKDLGEALTILVGKHWGAPLS